MKLSRIVKNPGIQVLIKIARLSYLPVYLYSKSKFKFSVKSSFDTADYLKSTGSSIARFGDGEINLMFRHKSIGFQPYSEDIKKDLLKILQNHSDNLAIGIPRGFTTTEGLKLFVRSFWWSYVSRNSKKIERMVKESGRTIFLDTNFSRTVTELRNPNEIRNVVRAVTNIWRGRSVIMVEGAGTRFGVGNGLLDGASKVYRIIAPATDAYSVLNDIIDAIRTVIRTKPLGGRPVLLVALGPTATIISAKLADEIQSIDIGHFDLQFEYLRQGSYKKTGVSTRYDNEVVGGSRFVNVDDKAYENEILIRLE